MTILTIAPANLRDGDELRDDTGTPFATVHGHPWTQNNSVWIHTDLIPIEFPPGTVAIISERRY